MQITGNLRGHAPDPRQAGCACSWIRTVRGPPLERIAARTGATTSTSSLTAVTGLAACATPQVATWAP